MDSKSLITLQEAAEILRLSRTKLYHERRAGRLKTLRFGRSVRLRQKDIRHYVSQAAKESA